MNTMEKTLCGLGIFTILLCSSSSAIRENSPQNCDARQQPISKIIMSLCSRLIKEIGGEDNFFISPLSISAAMAMIYIGAGGTTKAQMTNALQYHLAGEQCLEVKLGEEFKQLLLSLENRDKAVSLLMANSIFIRLGSEVSSNYTSKLQEYFTSDVQYLDFGHEEELSMRTINEWVSNHTNGQIRKLINEPLDHLTIMIIMNIIYFKGFWEHPFQKEATWNSFFYRRNSTTKIVPFMILQENLDYFHDEETNYAFLKLDYADRRTSMLLILPKHVRDFPDMDLTSEKLCSILRNLQPTDLMVVLPKFRLEFSRELSKDISNMGMEELFSDKANLSGIREQNDIHVSLMLHKAILEVNEEGSEASVVTGVGIDGRKRPQDQKIFWADHAFLFYIFDKKSNTVLFAGRVSEP